MKLPHLLLAGLIALPGSYAIGQPGGADTTQGQVAEQDTSVATAQSEDQVLADLKDALAKAETSAELIEIIAAAVVAHPSLQAKIQATAIQTGASARLVSAGVTKGLLLSKSVQSPTSSPSDLSNSFKLSMSFIGPASGSSSGGGGGGTASGG